MLLNTEVKTYDSIWGSEEIDALKVYVN